jgi:NitT/TauT family transport system substrate-binding protein
VVPYPGNVTQFLLNENYAQQAYAFSEPFVARQQGGDPHLLMVSDLGFNPYTSVLFTNESYIRDHAPVVAAMVAASTRGWARYLDDPAETNAHIQALNPEMGLEILNFGVETLTPLVRDEVARQHGIGHMSAERWQSLTDQMVEAELLKSGQVRADQAFTNQFLPADSKAAPAN